MFLLSKVREGRQFANSLGLPMCQVLHFHNREGKKNILKYASIINESFGRENNTLPPKKENPKPLHSLPVTHRGVSYENRFFYKSPELFKTKLTDWFYGKFY